MVKEGRKRESDGEGEEVSLLTSFVCLTDCVVLIQRSFILLSLCSVGEREEEGKG